MSGPCYCTVLRSATRRLAASYDAALAPAGINTAQFSLLRTVSRLQQTILTELGRRMELDRSTVGRNVRVLERMGLVQVGRGDDHREATVELTTRGMEVLEQAVPLWESVQLVLEERMGPEATRNLHALLNQL